MIRLGKEEIKERFIRERYIICPSCGGEINDLEHQTIADGDALECPFCNEEIEIGDNPY